MNLARSTPSHVLTLEDLGVDTVRAIIDRGALLADGATPMSFNGATLALLFEQPSTRTRTSFEAGMAKLGGQPIFLGPDETQLARGEPIEDVARALSQYVDLVAIRTPSHETITRFAEAAEIPVINALTDEAHPCQALADVLTIQQHVGPLDGTRAAWIGDGNNVGASFAVACAMSGVDLTVATPPAYAFDQSVRDRIDALGGSIREVTDPHEAVASADVVYTDVWVSMAEEDDTEAQTKKAAFDGFQLSDELLGTSDAAVMHCLPAHRGEEITAEVIDGPRSIVWPQARNRMYAQLALMELLLAGP